MVKLFSDGIWLSTEPVIFLGLHLTSTMTIFRLCDESLMLYSPVKMTPERREAVESLGQVGHLYAPNTYHHMWIGEWAQTFPEAQVHAPAGLKSKRPDLRIDRVHGVEPLPEIFDGLLAEMPVKGFMPEESVLYHRPSRTLAVADLIQNVGRPTHAWTKLYTRAMGFYDRAALSRILRWAAFSDKSRARQSVDKLLEFPIEKIIVGHGSPIIEDSRRVLASAYKWLTAER